MQPHGFRVSISIYHLRARSPHPAVFEVERQQKLLDACNRFSGVRLPA
jgi:hypothetical protein